MAILTMLQNAFQKAAYKDHTGGTTQLLADIVAERPDLAGKMSVVPQYGRTSHTVMFENEVFKAPKSSGTIADFIREYHVTSHLQGRGLPVPALTSTGEQSFFFGIERMPGVAFSRKHLALMTQYDVQENAKIIADFSANLATAFDQVDVKRIFSGHEAFYPSADKIKQAMDDEFVHSVLRYHVLDVDNLMDEYRERLAKAAPVVSYMDYGVGNILFDAGADRITGIIDFGHVQPAPPENGFIALRYNYGTAFAQAVCVEYATATGSDVTYRDVLLCALACDVIHLANHKNRNKDELITLLREDIGVLLNETGQHPRDIAAPVAKNSLSFK